MSVKLYLIPLVTCTLLLKPCTTQLVSILQNMMLFLINVLPYYDDAKYFHTLIAFRSIEPFVKLKGKSMKIVYFVF